MHLKPHQKRQRPLWKRALSVQQMACGRLAVVGTGGNARNVRAVEADIGQFAIAELGQFADIALIIPEAWIMRMSESNMVVS